jgi:hypothetical protein
MSFGKELGPKWLSRITALRMAPMTANLRSTAAREVLSRP